MIYVNEISDFEKLKDRIDVEYIVEIRNTFYSFYDSLGWDMDIDRFSLKKHGSIIVFENYQSLKKWINFNTDNPLIVDLWVFRKSSLFKIEINANNKLYRFLRTFGEGVQD